MRSWISPSGPLLSFPKKALVSFSSVFHVTSWDVLVLVMDYPVSIH